INELLSVNNSGIQDEDGEHSDWIELFNTSDDFVSLEGYFISDQIDNPYLFALPPIDLLPGEFLVVFCSGEDRSPLNGELHSNFKISSSEENIWLTDPMNNHFTFPVVYNGDNISFGSYPDAGNERIHFDQPTPGHSNTSTNGANQVLFSKVGGTYQDLFSLELSTFVESQEIRFSIDGTAPDSSSSLYTQPIELSEHLLSGSSLSDFQISPDEYQTEAAKHIKKSIVIRAASFNSSGNQTSEIETHSYFIEHLGSAHRHLPIVSICTEMDYLVNHSNGIFVPGINFNPQEPDWTGNYYQSGREWERSAHFEYHHPERKSYFSEIGLRTHGGNSRRHPQKGMRLYARSEYGNKKFRHPFFKNQETQEFKRLVLKPMSASWNDSGMQDLIANQMALNPEL
ncbi:MAG: chitobiase/beta-hexosaminidase C-terminal domain-containing protein, partial [Flavobacteriales bacterium]